VHHAHLALGAQRRQLRRHFCVDSLGSLRIAFAAVHIGHGRAVDQYLRLHPVKQLLGCPGFQ
jgi:hypothetical protein